MSVADAGPEPQACHPGPDHRGGQRPATAGRGAALISVLIGQGCCGGTGLADSASQLAQRDIPAHVLAIYGSVCARYRIPWEVLSGIDEEECDHGRNPDPSCTPQPGATGPGIANCAGASGPMQIGVGGGPCGSARDEYDSLRRFLPDPSLGPHDPTTAAELAALVLITDKGAPTGQTIDAYLPYVQAYNGSGPMAAAYSARVLADAHAYQGAGTAVLAGCVAVAAGTYVNPFVGEDFAASRNDQGVDYDPLKVEQDNLDAGGRAFARFLRSLGATTEQDPGPGPMYAGGSC